MSHPAIVPDLGPHKIPVPEIRMGQVLQPMEGLTCWRNPLNDFVVVRVHYTADPARRGDWRHKNAPAFGGLRSWRWRKEQEIDWEAMSGRLVFENWDELVHSPDPFMIPDDWPRWVLIDPGWVNPCSVLWVALDTDAEPNEFGHLPLHVYREFYQARTSSRHIARYVHDASMVTNLAGVAELEPVEQVLIDPSALQEQQSAASPSKTDESSETVFDQLQAEWDTIGWTVPVKTGNNHKNVPIEELIVRLGNYWCDHEGLPLYNADDSYRIADEAEILAGAYEVAPTLFVHGCCPNTIREIRMYRWREWASAEVRDRRNEPESPIDKHDHSITNLIRFVNELRELRDQKEGLTPVDLSSFISRFRRAKVANVDQVAREHHRRAAARYRKRGRRR